MKKEEMVQTKEAEDAEASESFTITATINKQFNKFMTPPHDLLTWSDMPEHLRFNPYVHKGKKKKENESYITFCGIFRRTFL